MPVISHISALGVEPEAEEPLVGSEDEVFEDEDSEFGGAASPRSQGSATTKRYYQVVLSVTAIGLVVVLAGAAALHFGGRSSVQADPAVFTSLDAMPQAGGPIMLEVGTSNLDYSETSSAVSAAFNFAGVWTPDQPLFDVARKGETKSTSATVPGWPSQVRLTIHGTDAYGMKFIRLTFAGETRILMDSPVGEEYPSSYGGNQFWLDADDNALPQQIYAVPGTATQLMASPPFVGQPSTAASPVRIVLICLTVVAVWLATVWALYFFYKEELLNLLGRGNHSLHSRPDQAPGNRQGPPPSTAF